MKVVVVGANGKIGRHLVARLGASDAHEVRAVVRAPEQVAHHESLGAEVVTGDLEGPRDELAGLFAGCAAVVFTAGSGGHTGADKTMLVDLWGAWKSVEAAEARGVERFLMVSAFGARDPDAGRAAMRHYHVAKAVADDRLARSGLTYTILRPGRLSDEPGTGRVAAGAELPYGLVPREDVASAIVAALEHEETYRRTVYLTGGDVPIAAAFDAL